MFEMIKPVLDENTLAKVSILGGKYHDTLHEIVDLENLPTRYGGKCSCSHHEGGCEKSNLGPWNDGTLQDKGYPKPFWEDVEKRDGKPMSVGDSAVNLNLSDLTL
jgi:hypothetical protein